MDNLNQVGKGLNKSRKAGDRSLKKDRPIKPQLERVRDTMDFKIPFDMKFEIGHENPRVTLDLNFMPPPRTGCCADCECATCEFFDGGITETLYQVTYGYIPGTVHAFKNNAEEITFLEETDPSAGLVTVFAHNNEGIIICYVYGICL